VRLFVGVELDDTVKAAAGEAADRLRAHLSRKAPGLDARWVVPGNLHLTLWFIGDVDEGRGAAIRAALGPPFGVPPFTLAIGGAGAFPPTGSPRVIWFGVRAGRDGMAALYLHVRDRLAPLGFAPERRDYAPHLTLARVRDLPRSSQAAFRQVLAQAPVDAGGCRVEAVTVFRSRLSPRGAAYEPVLRVPLS
jgi:2'-5' RNA ligase